MGCSLADVTAPSAIRDVVTPPAAIFAAVMAPSAIFPSTTAPFASFSDVTDPALIRGLGYVPMRSPPAAPLGGNDVGMTPTAILADVTEPSAIFAPVTAPSAIFTDVTLPLASFDAVMPPSATRMRASGPSAFVIAMEPSLDARLWIPALPFGIGPEILMVSSTRVTLTPFAPLITTSP